MANIRVKKTQPRKERLGGFWTDGTSVFIGRDWALQNAIDDAKRRTQNRSCFLACRTCGCCANSCRDATYPKSYDENSGKKVDCRGCEPYRFHDCHNGWMRDAHGDAEPFTDEALKLFKEGGKPLI